MMKTTLINLAFCGVVALTNCFASNGLQNHDTTSSGLDEIDNNSPSEISAEDIILYDGGSDDDEIQVIAYSFDEKFEKSLIASLSNLDDEDEARYTAVRGVHNAISYFEGEFRWAIVYIELGDVMDDWFKDTRTDGIIDEIVFQHLRKVEYMWSDVINTQLGLKVFKAAKNASLITRDDFGRVMFSNNLVSFMRGMINIDGRVKTIKK